MVNKGQTASLVESSQQGGTGGNFGSPQACSPSLTVLEEQQRCLQLGESYGSLCFVCGSVLFAFACVRVVEGRGSNSDSGPQECWVGTSLLLSLISLLFQSQEHALGVVT